MYRTYFKRHVTFSKFCVLFSLVLAFFISCNFCNQCALVILCYYDKKKTFICKKQNTVVIEPDNAKPALFSSLER